MKDALTIFIRESAQKMLKAAIEAEMTEFIDIHQVMGTDGKKQVVRNGYLPARKVQTGAGPIEVEIPRVRRRSKEPLIFTSSLVPKYMRRSVTVNVMLPLLYLKGISTKDFSQCFEPILGESPKNLSPNVISLLKNEWGKEFELWGKRDLSLKKYVYFWADGIYLQARMEHEKSCVLVIIGADEQGNKELVAALSDGYRESKESWKELLLDIKNRGLTFCPKISVGDGSLGFWGALNEVYPNARHQRCWVHKTANILDKLPKSERARAKSKIHNIYMAATQEDAMKAWNSFLETYQAKYPKVVACLEKDRDKLLTFYDFPAEHWIHLRTTNPIESTFSTVRHRTKKSNNCFSRETILSSVFKLLLEAEKRWKKLKGYKRLAEVINMEKFVNGENINELEKQKNLEQNYAA